VLLTAGDEPLPMRDTGGMLVNPIAEVETKEFQEKVGGGGTGGVRRGL
jgi:hypothetical protein